MTPASVANVESAIRHRNLSGRALIALALASATIAIAIALADRPSGSAEWEWADSPDLAWPEMATLALGHFSFCFVVAVAMAAVYELIVMRHLRGIARQVRSGTWLEDDCPVRLDRRWLGSSDDLDLLVGALNEARQFGAETRSALTWRLAQNRAADAARNDEIKALEAENAALRADLRGQSDYMRGAARTVRALAIASHAPRPAGEAVDATNVHDLWSGGPAAQIPGPAIDALNGVADDLASFASVADDHSVAVPVDLGELVRSVSSDLDAEIAAAGARVEVGDLPIILGDATALARLFGRLLGDVVLRACPDGLPVLSVKAAPHHHGLVRIRVAWEVRQPSLASRKTTRIGQSDLSVMLCRRLLRPHGGTLNLDSETGSGAAEIVAPCGQLKPAEDAPV